MPDQPPAILANEPVYWDLNKVAKITGRPLKLIQRWVMPGPNGEDPILPSIKSEDYPYKRLVLPEDLIYTTRKRTWGTRKTGRTRHLESHAGRDLPLTEREPTDSRWPDEP